MKQQDALDIEYKINYIASLLLYESKNDKVQKHADNIFDKDTIGEKLDKLTEIIKILISGQSEQEEVSKEKVVAEDLGDSDLTLLKFKFDETFKLFKGVIVLNMKEHNNMYNCAAKVIDADISLYMKIHCLNQLLNDIIGMSKTNLLECGFKQKHVMEYGDLKITFTCPKEGELKLNLN